MRSEPLYYEGGSPTVEPNGKAGRRARRIGARLLHEAREAFPPTIFFFIGFNLIVLTTNLLLADYGEAVAGFLLATGAALVVGKAVLVANAMRSIRYFDPLFRSAAANAADLVQVGFLLGRCICCSPARTLDPVLACRTPSTRHLPTAHGCDIRLASLHRHPALGYLFCS